MRALLVSLISALFLGACAVSTPTEPRTGFAMTGVTAASPNAPGWILISSSRNNLLFGASGSEPNESNVANTRVATGMPPHDLSDRALLTQMVAVSRTEGARFQLISKRDSFKKLNGAQCIQHNTVGLDPSAAGPGPQYLKVVGYFCLHPSRKDVLVSTDLSNRSGSKTMPAATQRLANQYFADTQFNTDGF